MSHEILSVQTNNAAKQNEQKFLLDESMEEYLHNFPISIKETYATLSKRIQKKIQGESATIQSKNENREIIYTLFGPLQRGSFDDFIRIADQHRWDSGFFTEKEIEELNPIQREIKTMTAIHLWIADAKIMNDIIQYDDILMRKQELYNILELIWGNRQNKFEDMHAYKEDEYMKDLNRLQELNRMRNKECDEILTLKQKKSLTRPQKARLEKLETDYMNNYGQSPYNGSSSTYYPSISYHNCEIENLFLKNQSFEKQKKHFQCMVEFLKYFPSDEAALFFAEKIDMLLSRNTKLSNETKKALRDVIDEWYNNHQNDKAMKQGNILSESQEKKFSTLVDHFWNYIQSYKNQLEREVPQIQMDNTISELRVLISLLGKF